MAVSFPNIGFINIPKSISRYVEDNGYRLIVEQTSFDAVNGYAVGIGTKIKIEQYCEYCTICGYHSVKNPNQKKLFAEKMHRLQRQYETIFYWDDYGPGKSLEQAFAEQIEMQRA